MTDPSIRNHTTNIHSENEQLITALADAISDRVVVRILEAIQRKHISRQEYATMHGIGLRTVDRAIQEKRLSVTRAGRRILIDANAVIED
ncbi:MAG: hypothetical protein MUC83_08160 [Pirellula sp.]|jgi:excisionase family DNA binding protein|nr:hypothetical protein [Pirellula sp.]